ncbi:MAG: glutathione S-transferase C-terminal domain-containing protein [Pseudomonadota bacterium]
MKPPILVNLAPAVSTDVCRWLFHHYKIDHRESIHVPVFHIFALAWYLTSNASRPVVYHNGMHYRTEEHITWHFEKQVPPDLKLIPEGALGQAAKTEQVYYHKTMRAGTIGYMYWNLLQDRDLVWPSFTMGTPGFEHPLAKLLWPLLRFALIKGLGLSEENATKGIDTVRAGFDRAEAALTDGRPYLCGDRFTIADITFAAGAAPILLDPGYAGHLPEYEQVPEHMQKVIGEFRARPAAQFVRRMYAEHREA